ncbi:MAG: hypothetical protein E7299_05295 [Lachnospiraceae bacterium]|nr:hypothetical protein [Lachnospiraceae bacterium]
MWILVLCLILYGIKSPKSYQIAIITYLSFLTYHVYCCILEHTPVNRAISLALVAAFVWIFLKLDLVKYHRYDLTICVFLQILAACELLVMYTSGKTDGQIMNHVMQFCGAGLGIGGCFFACRRWIHCDVPERMAERVLHFIIGTLTCILMKQLLALCFHKTVWGIMLQAFFIILYAMIIYPVLYSGLRKIITHNA